MTTKLDNIMVILDHYHLKYQMSELFEVDHIQPLTVMDWFKEELTFALKNRGEDDKEAFTAEFIYCGTVFKRSLEKAFAPKSLYSCKKPSRFSKP